MVGTIDRRVQAEAGEADVANGRHRLRRVVEQARGERERRRPAAANREDIGAILEQEAEVEELRREKIGRANGGTPVNNAHTVCRLSSEKKHIQSITTDEK